MDMIAAVRCFRVSAEMDLPPWEERQIGMLDSYPDLAARKPPARSKEGWHHAIYVEIETSEGATGLFGPIFPETSTLILERLAPHLIGKDPIAAEFLWDIMYRQDRHARTGNQMMAISAVDNALWDLRGKLLGQPVYRLLGGPTRNRVDCYASMLGHSLDSGLVRERAQAVANQGFKAQKWFFRYGPADGLAGMERNVEMVRTVREAVGPNVEIMLDCWMGWDTTYAIRMLERIAGFQPRWLEEPVPPDRLGDLAAIRRSSNVPVATGEHEYTRWGFLRLLQADAVDVIQADPDWCGGMSELVKIATLASAYGKQVVPHGHSVPAALHAIASRPPSVCPMAEYLILSQPTAQYFHQFPMVPDSGSLHLPGAHGLGVSLDDAKVDRREELGEYRQRVH